MQRIISGMHAWHSTKWPILAFAMTGMVTAAMISLIIFGSDILATPPCARMSAGTRSRAMTATAPASSAMRAYTKNLISHCLLEDERGGHFKLTCSAFITSMMTPPCNMRARPVFTVKVGSVVPAVAPAAAPLMGNSVDIVSRNRRFVFAYCLVEGGILLILLRTSFNLVWNNCVGEDEGDR